MSHYDEIRDEYDSMTDKEKRDKYLADKARKVFSQRIDILKNALLKKHIENHSKLNIEHTHSKEYWDKNSEEILRLIKDLDKESSKCH